MKQKVVIKLQVGDSKKRRKAMKLVAGLPGVLSAAIEGADKNHMVVVGDGVDSVHLTTLLRKNMGFAELISVNTLNGEEGDKHAVSTPVVAWSSYGGGYPTEYPLANPAEERYPYSSCCIM